MKILIIALPRTGSSSLSYDLSIQYNLKECFEPFDVNTIDNYNESDDDIVLKTLIFQNSISFYKTLIKQFDKVILLSRKNLYECAKSWAFLDYNKHINSLEKYIWYETPNFEKTYENITKWNDEMNLLSTEVGIDIIYYEDIFDENSNDRLRIKEMDLKKEKTII